MAQILPWTSPCHVGSFKAPIWSFLNKFFNSPTKIREKYSNKNASSRWHIINDTDRSMIISTKAALS